jgi:hypothetical protein
MTDRSLIETLETGLEAVSQMLSRSEEHPSGAEALVDFARLAARLKSCPDTIHLEILA